MLEHINGLHYCPDNGWFGDAMPMYHDGVYHIYFNKAFRFANTPRGTFRGGWGHISTRDFITFTEHPDAFLYEDLERGKNLGNPVNSGCVFYGKGEWHAYYASYPVDTDKIVIRHAVSDDGISFRYVEDIFERPSKWYRLDENFRDPAVIWDEERQEYHMVFCAKPPKTEAGPNHYSGTVGHAVSADLYHWECLPPLEITGVANTMECPELYYDNEKNKWVLIYYYHETRIRTSDSLDGPWKRGKVLAPDNFDFMAGRQMFDGQRHVMVGWICRRDNFGQRIPGRCMLFPRELRLLEDGQTPATRFVREITKLFDKPNDDIVPNKIIPGGPGWSVKDNRITVKVPNGGTMAGWKHLPTTCYMNLDLMIEDLNGEVELLLGVTADYWSRNPAVEWADKGIKLIIDPSEGLIRIRDHYEWDQQNEITILPYRFEKGQPIHLEILRDGEILEIGINEERTVAALMPDSKGGNFAISVQDTSAVIENLAVWEMNAF